LQPSAVIARTTREIEVFILFGILMTARPAKAC
jgi:hypothetical protein